MPPSAIPFSLDLDLRSKHNPLKVSLQINKIYFNHIPSILYHTTNIFVWGVIPQVLRHNSPAEVSGLVDTMDNVWLKFHDEKCSDSTKLLSLKSFEPIKVRRTGGFTILEHYGRISYIHTYYIYMSSYLISNN